MIPDMVVGIAWLHHDHVMLSSLGLYLCNMVVASIHGLMVMYFMHV